jgi:hypothetical protein
MLKNRGHSATLEADLSEPPRGTEPGQYVLWGLAAHSLIATKLVAPVTTAEQATSSTAAKG